MRALNPDVEVIRVSSATIASQYLPVYERSTYLFVIIYYRPNTLKFNFLIEQLILIH